MLNNALAGRNRSASDVSRFRLSSVQLRNHEVGYFDPLLWAVRVMICVATFCIGGKCSVVLCLKNRKSGGVSSLKGAIVAKTTWAHWHTCSPLLNFTQHLCSMDIK